MRTTVEISKDQHLKLIELAARRGLRGFSPLVQEAVADYLAAHDQSSLSDALAAEGLLSDDQADKLEKTIDEAWASWTPA